MKTLAALALVERAPDANAFRLPRADNTHS
jgi:hypothetical protein